MLEFRELTKNFGRVRAVDAVSLAIEPGSMVGVIGRSGAGKSTLLRLVNRLTDPSAGRILFGDTDVSRLRGQALLAWRARCAMIFQQFNLVGRLDVLTNVLVARMGYRDTWSTLVKWFSKAERAMAVRALERLGMDGCALQRADTLSGGQQQRVAIARALVQQPEILLADEPIASLDPHNAAIVMDALEDINKKDGITVICNLHHLHTARRYCRRIIGMSGGRIVFDGPPEDLSLAKVREVYGSDLDNAELKQATWSAEPEIGDGDLAAACA